MAGKDATDAFINYHPASVWKKHLPYFHVADVVTNDSEFVKEYREIRRNLLERGLFQTRTSFYVGKALILLALLASSVAGVLCFTSTLAHMVAAVLMATFWQQLAFIGHDTGHNAITHVQTADNLIGIFCGNFLGGVSIGWWKRSHNVHHIVCNSVEHDPDIQHLPAFAITSRILRRYFSSYHSKVFNFDAPARALVCVQHWLYYPIMALARFNLYAQSYLLLLSREAVAFKPLELAGLLGFAAWFLALLSAVPSGERLPFLLISHGLAGILHVQITLSHFPMPAYEGRGYNDDSDGWFRTQLLTTMNVKSNWATDWFHGGLQFQIEHHLLPRLPRHNLRAARALVKPFAAKWNVPYIEVSFWEGNCMVMRTLYNTALAARARKDVTWGDFAKSLIWDSVNVRG